MNPKNRPVYRNALAQLLDGRTPFSGSLLIPRSVPADRLNVTQLSAITANMGRLTAGTAIFGDENGAHTRIGSEARDGIQMASAPNKIEFAVTPTPLGVTFRLGAPNTPGITMAGGTIVADGDINALGSIRTNRLAIIGNGLAYALLETDRFLIGSGDWDAGTFTGGGITQWTFGEYNAGAEVWVIDTNTGCIVTRDLDQPTDIYAQFGSKQLHFQNVDTWVGDPNFYNSLSMLTFATRYQSQGTTQTIGIASDGLCLKIIDLDSTTGQPFITLDNMDGLQGSWGGDYLYFTGRYSRKSGLIRMDDTGATVEQSMRLSISNEQATPVELASLQLDEYGMLLTHGADRPATPEEGRLRYDSTNHRWEYFDNTEWRYLQNAAAA